METDAGVGAVLLLKQLESIKSRRSAGIGKSDLNRNNGDFLIERRR
jgi:hypothetical protein